MENNTITNQYSSYALLNYEGVVTNIIILDSNNEEYLNSLKAANHVSNAIKISDQDSVAHIGGTWDGTRFYPVKPFASWSWSDLKERWVAPTPMPDDTLLYYWNESLALWEEV
jgi:hypothetical protein